MSIFFGTVFYSCSTVNNTAVNKNLPPSAVFNEYIEKYSSAAISNMKKTGVPASITLAQGILESGGGRSFLAEKGNNHFGIKCGKGWNGKKIYKSDDTYNECFRKYKYPEESFYDHAEFLQRPRYAKLFKLNPEDYKAWAKGLKEAGYATNPKYAAKLIDIIERYNLNIYDKIVAEKKFAKSM